MKRPNAGPRFLAVPVLPGHNQGQPGHGQPRSLGRRRVVFAGPRPTSRPHRRLCPTRSGRRPRCRQRQQPAAPQRVQKRRPALLARYRPHRRVVAAACWADGRSLLKTNAPALADGFVANQKGHPHGRPFWLGTGFKNRAGEIFFGGRPGLEYGEADLLKNIFSGACILACAGLLAAALDFTPFSSCLL